MVTPLTPTVCSFTGITASLAANGEKGLMVAKVYGSRRTGPEMSGAASRVKG
ncbi:hypothetical protein GCM10027022_06200 [Alpinimonas psychrophila]